RRAGGDGSRGERPPPRAAPRARRGARRRRLGRAPLRPRLSLGLRCARRAGVALMTPPVPTEAMFPGLLGELVEASVEATEADAACVGAQFLVALGAVLGRGPHVLVGETRHALNEFLLVVGPTSSGAKGDGANVALMPLLDAAHPWYPRSGLSSG